jgi:hypothetical protein
MKRLLVFTIALVFLTMPTLAVDKNSDYPKEIISNVGRSFIFSPSTRGVWVSSDENVAQVSSRGVINFMAQGKAIITFTSVSNKISTLDVTVGPAGQMPQMIRQGIDIALQDWEAAKGEAFPRSNKYTFWLHNAKSSFGWCGAFINYSLEQASVPMQRGGETILQTDGNAHSVREAAVSKLWMGFSVMDRIAYIPQPGYLVIYGKSGSTPYIHVGLVTDVAPLGEGRYELKTVEGNMNNRILRYNYIYDAYASRVDKNMISLPEDQRSQPEIFRYELHARGEWYITAFGQTWY